MGDTTDDAAREPVVDGILVRRLRVAQGMSMVDLATAAGIDHAVVSRIEREVQADARVSALARIAGALGVPMDALLRRPMEAPTMDAELEVEMRAIARLGRQRQRLAAVMLRAYRSALADTAGDDEGEMTSR